MSIATLQSVTAGRPLWAEIDVCGQTHPGFVREANNDHFLVASFHRTMRIHGSSLGDAMGPHETQQRGLLLLVADGVGDEADAGKAAAHALNTVAQHLLHETELCSQIVAERQEDAVERLRESVIKAHQTLLGAEAGGSDHGATTLTMYAAFWPFAFVLHVGDSRLYRYRDGVFERLTTDQTLAQIMIDTGAMTADAAEHSPFKHVLWSAIGSTEVLPEDVVTDCTRRGVVLLCTDGLTKHVSDAEIASHMSRHAPTKKTCQALIDLALSRGGSDNVTVVMGRTKQADDED